MPRSLKSVIYIATWSAFLSILGLGCGMPDGDAHSDLGNLHLLVAEADAGSDVDSEDPSEAAIQPREVRGPRGRRLTIDEILEQGLDHSAGASFGPDGVVVDQPAVAYQTAARPTYIEGPLELPEADEKIGPGVQDWLRTAPDSDELLDVLVAFPSRYRMPRRQRLDRSLPRDHVENQAVLSSNWEQIQQVAELRRTDRDSAMAHVASFRHPIVQEFTFGNGIRTSLSAGEVKELSRDPGVASIDVAISSTPGPNVQWGRDALRTDGWHAIGAEGIQNPALFVALVDSGLRPTVVSFQGTSAGVIGTQLDCVFGDADCLFTGNSFYDPTDPIYGHGTAAGNVIMGGVASTPGWGAPIEGVSNVSLDTFNLADQFGWQAFAVTNGIKAASALGDQIIVVESQIQQGFSGLISSAADDAFENVPPHVNLWVIHGGSDSFPSLWNRAISACS